MTRLIVVSNRVSAPTDAAAPSSGGLAMALRAALQDHGGLWFGWSGETSEHAQSEPPKTRTVGGIQTVTAALTEHELETYYNGYANRTLWPLLHQRLDLMASDRELAKGYLAVNARFAALLAPLIEPDDQVWVHDYHLIPLASELRKLGVTCRIGFFLHTPWPAHQIFRALPEHRARARELLAYDLIGFQTEEWRRAFEDYLARDDAEIAAETGRQPRTGVYPIGIDAEAFAKALETTAAGRAHDRLMASCAFRKVLLGVDRLDYSKGLEDRLRGFEQFLADNPDQHRRVTFVQIANLSREQVESYQQIRARLDALAGHINGAYADFDWSPVRYVNREHRRDHLAGLYRAAHVGLVTPLIDGMNLVAKEYVAAQNPDDPGVLILSRFAGAAEQMKDALLINPYSADELADAIRRALAMPKQERLKRWETLAHGVRTDDVTAWRRSFLKDLSASA
ncbi:trehalose-6-phosphate synthase [Brevundimonas sp. 2R-24]|uniref:Trehalose-6-phosphate synthase n=1 Tax=Peiella sedimenti TaxID=3061083 RepID=A0ABT8SLM8_9CAUL|nr:trehalose-6-phosphate synthase [Caulobacteraceae bacterium XZ-24]